MRRGFSVRVPTPHREAVERAGARRVMRLMARYAQPRSLRAIVATLHDFLARQSSFRHDALSTAVAKHLCWAGPAVLPTLSEFLWAAECVGGDDCDDAMLRDALCTKHPEDPKVPRPQPHCEVTRLTALLACMAPPSGQPNSCCPAGAATRIDAYDGLERLTVAVQAGGARSQLEIFDAVGTTVSNVDRELEHAMRLTGTTTPRSVLATVAGAEAVAARVVATCPPAQRARFEVALTDDSLMCARRAGLRAVDKAVRALKTHGGLGAADALWSWVASADASPLCDKCQRLERKALERTRAIVEDARKDWRAIEDEGIGALLELRSKFQSSRVRSDLEAAVRADAGAMRAIIGETDHESEPQQLPRVGRAPRRKKGKKGSLIQVSLDVSCPSVRGVERRVFIENLPGSIDEATLTEAFARAGTVVKVDVFCPGFREARTAFEDFRTTRAPVQLSPTCALVEFKERKAAEAATTDSLRIFGLVLDRRPCRTRPARDLQCFYLHNITLAEAALSTELSKALGKSCATPPRIWRKDPYLPPETARLRFRSHSAAFFAWRRLERHPASGFELSWSEVPPPELKSPEDVLDEEKAPKKRKSRRKPVEADEDDTDGDDGGGTHEWLRSEADMAALGRDEPDKAMFRRAEDLLLPSFLLPAHGGSPFDALALDDEVDGHRLHQR